MFMLKAGLFWLGLFYAHELSITEFMLYFPGTVYSFQAFAKAEKLRS